MLALPFLLENEDIKIHVPGFTLLVRTFLNDIGIARHRLVTNNVHARLAYIPAGTGCGKASVIPINLLSIVLRKRLEIEYKQDTIVLIKRSRHRWFSYHHSILQMLKGLAEDLHLQVKVFGDRPSPSMQKTRRLFNRAVMVVGPHGAGLSNIIFSQPGTCVIEGLCYGQNKRFNYCYKHLSQVLGHIYHGIIPTTDCFNLGPNGLVKHVKMCLGKTTKK